MKQKDQNLGLSCVISDKVPIQCAITGNTKVVKLKVSPKIGTDEVLRFVDGFEKIISGK